MILHQELTSSNMAERMVRAFDLAWTLPLKQPLVTQPCVQQWKWFMHLKFWIPFMKIIVFYKKKSLPNWPVLLKIFRWQSLQLEGPRELLPIAQSCKQTASREIKQVLIPHRGDFKNLFSLSSNVHTYMYHHTCTTVSTSQGTMVRRSISSQETPSSFSAISRALRRTWIWAP